MSKALRSKIVHKSSFHFLLSIQVPRTVHGLQVLNTVLPGARHISQCQDKSVSPQLPYFDFFRNIRKSPDFNIAKLRTSRQELICRDIADRAKLCGDGLFVLDSCKGQSTLVNVEKLAKTRFERKELDVCFLQYKSENSMKGNLRSFRRFSSTAISFQTLCEKKALILLAGWKEQCWIDW